MTQIPSKTRPVLCFVLCLAGILVLLFLPGFDPAKVLFSNDGPLGAISVESGRGWACFSGMWGDLNFLGSPAGSFSPNLTGALYALWNPVYLAKFYAPLTLLFLGLCAWFCFRQMNLAGPACLIGGLAVALNSEFFSVSCWGVGPQAICFGLNYLAMGLVVMDVPRWSWARYCLAGLAVGLGVTEGADIGALFSLYFAAFVLFRSLTTEASLPTGLVRGGVRVAAVAFFAAFIAAHSLNVLTKLEIKGVAGTKQDTESKAQHWDWATQWSLPKRETLSMLVPGLFGYRVDTPKDMALFAENFEGGNYWGAMGRDPAWYRYYESGGQGPAPSGFLRFSGGGIYAGVPVVLVALWAALQALRRKDSVFSLAQRKLLWFWMGTIVIGLLLAYGRFAPFYRFLYALPYFSTIRNPVKFLHLVTFSMLVLFAFGVHGLWQHYMAGVANQGPRLKNWWARAGAFDRRWVAGCAFALGLSLLARLIYGASRKSLVEYLQTVQFDGTMATALADFSVRQVGWFVLFLFLAAGLVALILNGVFAGHRAKWGGILLGLLVVIDLGRANLPWLVYWDYKQKYASNDILKLLRDKPYEHRVAILPFRSPPELSLLDQLYRIEWTQHHFLYYNVQSLDVIQMPRTPEDILAYKTALHFDGNPTNIHRVIREWQLTNTRYLLGPAGFLDALNQELDPIHHRFHIAAAFEIVLKPGITQFTRLEELTAVIKPDGRYALFEFSGALPRAKLYSNWQASTNEQTVLEHLGSSSFDPEKSVMVDGALPSPMAVPSTNQNTGTVAFASYAPKRIVLKAEAAMPTVLLLNDRYDPNWKVMVDGKPDTLLRCNYLVRGVSLPAGAHTVEFSYQPPMGFFFVSLAAVGLGLTLCGLLIVANRRPAPTSTQARGSASPLQTVAR